MRAPGAPRAGFTLLEVLAVVFLIGLVLGVALDVYADLSRATRRAADHTRSVRRAVAILDRVARDLEGAVLAVKPAEVDPLEHAWLFLAESRYAHGGSDHVKFVTRNHRPRRSESHESDLAVVSYSVRHGENEDLELRRHSSPQLPEGLDRDFPPDDDAHLLADGLATFRLRFLREDGEWATAWDSSQLEDSSDLPVAVEIQLALRNDAEPEREEPELYSRRVLLPIRPLDLVVLLDPTPPETGEEAGDGELDEEGQEETARRDGVSCNGPTVAECFDRAAAARDDSTVGRQSLRVWGSSQDCFAEVGHLVSAHLVKPECR